MFIAKNQDGERIWADSATKSEKYSCPCCGGEVTLRDGPINAAHLAHIGGECRDSWHYDMPEWHKSMQALFPEEAREVVVKDETTIHRADVLVDKTVVEFQHSPISQDEFQNRNQFFRKHGYRIAWVFDVQEAFDEKRIDYSDEDSGDMFVWSNPPRVFKVAPDIIDYSKDFSLWLAYRSCDEEPIVLHKVIWTVKTEDGSPSLSRFIISLYEIDADKSFDVNLLFYSKYDYLRDAEVELRKKAWYKMKYIGERGHNPFEYTCPINQKFGVSLSGENGCPYCPYCGMYAEKERYRKRSWHIYCCYPTQVREKNPNAHPGYECMSAERFPI